MKKGKVIAVSKSATHTFHKFNQKEICLLKGLGVEGDAHLGKTVKHRSRVAKDPTQPNLRQVHLIHQELHQELEKKGFPIAPGEMGENITTLGIDVLSLPRNTILKIGVKAQVQVTGLRNPCSQFNDFQDGLLNELVEKDKDGNIIRKAGIMGIILEGGIVKPNDEIIIEYPEPPFQKLEKV